MVSSKKQAAKGKEKVKSKRLVLEDYEDCLTLAQNASEKLFSDLDYEDLIPKLEHKIEQLENPPIRTPKVKQGFECVKCKHRFKQVVNHCTTCDSTKIRKISLDEFMK